MLDDDSEENPVSKDTESLLKKHERNSEGKYSIDEAIEAIGMGESQYRAIGFVCSAWAFVCATQMTITPFLLRGLEVEFQMTSLAKGAIASSAMIGAMAGGPACGMASDAFGRRKVVIASIIIATAFTMLGSVMPNVWLLGLMRSIVGAAVNGVLVITNNMICEILPMSTRGVWLAFMHIAWQVGALGMICLTYVFEISQWRALMATASLPAIPIIFASFYMVKESPRWLLVTNHQAEAERILYTMATLNCTMPLKGELQVTDVNKEDGTLCERVSHLTRGSVLPVTLTAFGLWFFLNWAEYGNQLFFLEYFTDEGKPDVGHLCYLALIVGKIFGILILMTAVELFDRRVWLVFGFTICSGLTIMFVKVPIDALIVTIAFLLGVTAETCWGELYILTPEIFPSTVRGTGSGMVSGPGRSGAILVSFFGPMFYSLNHDVVFVTTASAFLLAALIAAYIPYETRDRPLRSTFDYELLDKPWSERSYRDKPLIGSCCGDNASLATEASPRVQKADSNTATI